MEIKLKSEIKTYSILARNIVEKHKFNTIIV